MNDELRDLIERTSLVDEMSKTQGWTLLKDRANIAIGAKQRRLLSGNVVDLNEYKELAGYVAGALAILDLPAQMQKELKARIESETDDAA